MSRLKASAPAGRKNGSFRPPPRAAAACWRGSTPGTPGRAPRCSRSRGTGRAGSHRAAASKVIVVEPVAVRTDLCGIADTVRVLPDRGLRLQEHPDRFPVGFQGVLPVGLDRVPAVAQPFGVRVAVLGDDRGDALGVPGGEPEPDRRTVVEHVQREAVEAEPFRQALDDVGELLEGVVEVTARGHVRLAEAGQVGSDEVEPVGEQRDQLAEHVARGQEPAQGHQCGCVRFSGLPGRTLSGHPRPPSGMQCQP